jgi:hypothetical protein
VTAKNASPGEPRKPAPLGLPAPRGEPGEAGEASALEAVTRLLRVRDGDPLFGDLYDRRARELLAPILSEDRYRALAGAEASVQAAVRESRVALIRGDWARVKELAGQVSALRRAAQEHQAELALGGRLYGPPRVAIDPFSPGFAPLLGISPESLLRRRDDLVRDLAALEGADAPWRSLYAERRGRFAGLSLAADAPAPDRSGPLDPERARDAALAALDSGDLDRLEDLAETMLAHPAAGAGRAREAAEQPGEAATEDARARASAPAWPDPVVGRARGLGLVPEWREANPLAARFLRAIARDVAAGDGRTVEGSRRLERAVGHGLLEQLPEGARELAHQFAIHAFVTSLGVRYVPPLAGEWVLVEDFPEEPPVPEGGPLLEALGLPHRRALSRVAIERAMRARAAAVLEGLGLEPRRHLLVCIPMDVYSNVGARHGWGRQQHWTHFDGYQLLADGALRALVGGDARFGGLLDACSIARDDEREGVVARFAVVHRDRMRPDPP